MKSKTLGSIFVLLGIASACIAVLTLGDCAFKTIVASCICVFIGIALQLDHIYMSVVDVLIERQQNGKPHKCKCKKD